MVENQPTPTPQPTTSIDTPAQPKTPNPTIFLVIIVILLGITGFLTYQNYQLKQQITQTQSTLNPDSVPPSPATNPTGDWETYSYSPYSSYNFSFRHPSTISISDNQGSIMLYDSTSKSPIPKGYMSIHISSNSKNMFYGENYKRILPYILELDIGNSYVFEVGATNWKQTITRSNDIEISGITAYVFESEDAWERPGPWKVIHVPLANDYLIIEITYDEKDSFDFKNTFAQILSTFQFME